jgi:XTP/dITP diphosphohydrolase
MKSLYLATQNVHKVEELSALLGSHFRIHSISELPISAEIPETGLTLAENSMQKARYVAERFGVTCLADDSGLEVRALGGAPGVFSARFAGEPKNDQANCSKLVKELQGVTDRQARFVTVLTYHEGGTFVQFEGEVLGTITQMARGDQGFGYDPLFEPLGEHRTFAEMTMAEKNKIAHRGRALEKFKQFVDETLLFHDE